MVDCNCNNFPASLGNITFGASVGIGANPPAEKLHVSGGQLLVNQPGDGSGDWTVSAPFANAELVAARDDLNGSPSIQLHRRNVTVGWIGIGKVAGPKTMFQLRTRTDNLDGRAGLDVPGETWLAYGATDQNVGIGTTSPSEKLQVDGSFAVKGPRPWIDVRAYGAKGDGVTDDQPAFQNAINAVPVTGGVIVVPPGTYLLNSGLTLNKSNLRILGMGPRSQIRANGGFRVFSVSASKVVIDSLLIDGQQAGEVANADLVYVASGSSFVAVRNCMLLNSRQSAIFVDGASNTLVINNSVKHRDWV